MNERSVQSQVGILSVIGLGYIGLPTVAMFASTGLKPVGVDISRRAVDAINEGRAHIRRAISMSWSSAASRLGTCPQ
jgi:UDP-N-acetyl-D-mannosaminuronate dehydrogenase